MGEDETLKFKGCKYANCPIFFNVLTAHSPCSLTIPSFCFRCEFFVVEPAGGRSRSSLWWCFSGTCLYV